MYTAASGGGSAQQQQQQQGFANYHGPHQYRSLIAKHNNNYQLYLNNLKNLYAYNTMKSSASANNKYNKFMFNHQNHHHHNHPQQAEVGFMLNAGGQQNGHLAAAAAAAAVKSKEQHFMQSYFRSQKNMNHQQQQLQQQGYQKAGSVYSLKDHGGGGNNSSSMSESEQKQIRRMRSTQSMPPGSACGCNGRSKSMEDIRDVIVDWTPEVAAINGAKQKLMNNAALMNNGSANSNYFMNQKNNQNNHGGGGGAVYGNTKHSETYGYNSNNRRFIANANYIINGQLANIKNKNNMRRSMDNLLDIETNYTPQFNTQVFHGAQLGSWELKLFLEEKFWWKEDHRPIIRSAGFRSILKEQYFIFVEIHGD